MVSARSNRVVALIGTGSSVMVNATVDGGLFGSLFVYDADTPVPTWLPPASMTTKLHWMVLAAERRGDRQHQVGRPVRPPTLIVPVIGDRVAAPSILASSCQDAAVDGHVASSSLSRDMVIVAG